MGTAVAGLPFVGKFIFDVFPGCAVKRSTPEGGKDHKPRISMNSFPDAWLGQGKGKEYAVEKSEDR
jgi:hypothetical protein